MRGIYNKELTQYFTSMIGYIFVAVFLAICGLFFYLGNLASQSSDIKVFFSTITTFLVFLVPILTMRIYSEERKQYTEALLLTAPMEIWEIVVGKFLAALTLFVLPLVMTLPFPILLARYGTCEVLVTVGNYGGMVLIGGACIAIGLFVSILSENQIVAAIVTYSILIVLFSVNQVSTMLGEGILSRLFQFVAIHTHFTKLTYGVLDLVDLVYFISIIALFLFLSIFVLDRKRRV